MVISRQFIIEGVKRKLVSVKYLGLSVGASHKVYLEARGVSYHGIKVPVNCVFGGAVDLYLLREID